MTRTTLVRWQILIVAVLFGVAPVVSSELPIGAVIQHAVATSYASDDPDVAAFRLKFDVQLSNRSDKAVNVPAISAGKGETTRIAVLGVQTKQSDGTWAPIVQSSWYDAGGIKYDSCGTLSGGRTESIQDVGSGLLLLRKQLGSLGPEPTVRLDLLLLCRRPDGNVSNIPIKTEPFSLRLLPHP